MANVSMLLSALILTQVKYLFNNIFLKGPTELKLLQNLNIVEQRTMLFRGTLD